MLIRCVVLCCVVVLLCCCAVVLCCTVLWWVGDGRIRRRDETVVATSRVLFYVWKHGMVGNVNVVM